MFSYNLEKVDYQLSNELKMNRIRYSKAPPQKGGSETLIHCFTSQTDILSMKLCYKVFLC